MVVLFIVLFFYGHPPVYTATILDSPEQCARLAPKAKQAAETRSDVRLAQVACILADGNGDKV